MTTLYVKLIVRAIMNFPGSHGYSIIKNLLALPIVPYCTLLMTTRSNVIILYFWILFDYISILRNSIIII